MAAWLHASFSGLPDSHAEPGLSARQQAEDIRRHNQEILEYNQAVIARQQAYREHEQWWKGGEEHWIRSTEESQRLAEARGKDGTQSADVVEWSKRQAGEALSRKQTAFETDGRDALVSGLSPPAIDRAAEGKSQSTLKTVRIRTLSSQWRWESGYQKKPVGGRFEWIERNAAIDQASVCQNYEKGSFLYSDCRKGAKLAFKTMCGRYEPACLAGRTLTP